MTEKYLILLIFGITMNINQQKRFLSLYIFFENWLTKHKWATLVTMQPDIYHQNSQSFYPSEPFQKTYHYETPCSFVSIHWKHDNQCCHTYRGYIIPVGDPNEAEIIEECDHLTILNSQSLYLFQDQVY